MKIKNILLNATFLVLMLSVISCVSAADNMTTADSNLTTDDGSLLHCDDSESITTCFMPLPIGRLPTFIEVTFDRNCNYPEEISGYDGSTVDFTAEVKIYFSAEVKTNAIGDGTLSLLKDGEVIDVKDLSEDSTPIFSLRIEKGHTYTLKYEGTYSHDGYWYYMNSDKTLEVKYKDDYWNR